MEYNEICIDMKNFNDSLFEFLETACLSDGGDGDSLLISSNYKTFADEFGRWCELNNNGWWTREDFDEYVYFYNDQEAIWFASTDAIMNWRPTATVKLY